VHHRVARRQMHREAPPGEPLKKRPWIIACQRSPKEGYDQRVTIPRSLTLSANSNMIRCSWLRKLKSACRFDLFETICDRLGMNGEHLRCVPFGCNWRPIGSKEFHEALAA